MTAPRFTRFICRTTDVDAAKAFYGAVIGGQGDAIYPLHESALARGARPHWLGLIGVSGTQAVTARFVERGATRLGPPDLADPVVLRDAGGALVGLTEATDPSRAGVVWHYLDTVDPERAARNYAELVGFVLGERIRLGSAEYRQFSWGDGGVPVGSIGDVARDASLHPQWLHFFGVTDLDGALGVVRARGGIVLATMMLPNGDRLAACDDAQGAGFGLMQPSVAA